MRSIAYFTVIAAAALTSCSSKNGTPLVTFDAGLPGADAQATDAEPADLTFLDAATSTHADANMIDLDAGNADAFELDAERAETGPADTGELEDAMVIIEDAMGFPDAERLEAGPPDFGVIEDAEVDAGIDDAGLDAGIGYDANICTGEIIVRGACTDCAEALCCNELATCNASFTCYSEFQNCLLPCTQNNLVSVCMAQCLFSPEGIAVRNCTTNQCAAVCP